MGMVIGKAGLELIKSFESLKLTAYKAVPSEKYYTIGWGHYGPDVSSNMRITTAKADALLKKDLAAAEAAVNKYYSKYKWNQNEFDALVSFAYNVGSINGLTLNGTRSRAAIRTKILEYNKSGGKVYNGLTRRRNKELELFNTPNKKSDSASKSVEYYKKYTGSGDSIVLALQYVGVKDVSKAHRAKIAVKNNICSKESAYTGSTVQNTKMLSLLRSGKLIKA